MARAELALKTTSPSIGDDLVLFGERFGDALLRKTRDPNERDKTKKQKGTSRTSETRRGRVMTRVVA